MLSRIFYTKDGLINISSDGSVNVHKQQNVIFNGKCKQPFKINLRK